MDFSSFIELFSNTDQFIANAAQAGAVYVYLVLFMVYFLETGIVLCAVLPGDSLIFVCGAAAAAGLINPWLAFIAITAGACFGNNLSYIIGYWLGNRIYDGSIKWINPVVLAKTKEFFKAHGGKTILLSRFFPFIRSCAPMIAGTARMDLWHFNVSGFIGAVLWAGIIEWVGYLFGNIPFIKDNLSLILVCGIMCGVGPMLIAVMVKAWQKGEKVHKEHEERKEHRQVQ